MILAIWGSSPLSRADLCRPHMLMLLGVFFYPRTFLKDMMSFAPLAMCYLGDDLAPQRLVTHSTVPPTYICS